MYIYISSLHLSTLGLAVTFLFPSPNTHLLLCQEHPSSLPRYKFLIRFPLLSSRHYPSHFLCNSRHFFPLPSLRPFIIFPSLLNANGLCSISGGELVTSNGGEVVQGTRSISNSGECLLPLLHFVLTISREFYGRG